ncbi:MAG: penicillin-binding protein activator, partial [Thalassotalea sp.]|nr:penicillin-binding protein activator [Thalassotalea sp.]
MNNKIISQHSFFLLITLIISSVLFSCSSNKVTVKKEQRTPNVVEVITDKTFTAQQYLDQAQNASPNQATELLILASQRFIVENQLVKALWLADKTLPLVDNQSQQKQLLLIKAESLLLSNNVELALQSLKKIQKVSSFSQAHLLKYYQTIAAIQIQRGLNLAAVDAQLRAFDLNTDAAKNDVQELWLSLNNLSQWEIDQLVTKNPPHIDGWQQLLNFAHRFGYDAASFNRYLAQWQRQFSLHPANTLLPQLMNENLVLPQFQQNIAVILPLSGRQKAAGESAQQGILSAYNNDKNKKLHFIDSNKVDMPTLSQQLIELEVNYVIGPLLKEKVDKYLAQTDLTLPTLLFNMPNNGELKEQ